MTQLKFIDDSLTGKKYKPGLNFEFRLTVPDADVSEYALLVDHDGYNEGNVNALLRLASLLGATVEETVAVGDSQNDLDNLRHAGLALAMSNATDEVKAAAHRTVCHNDEHVMAYIAENIV